MAAEIEAIRAGKWDTEIEKGLEIDEGSPDRPALSPQSEVCPLFWLEFTESQLGVFVANQRNRGLWVRPHRCVRYELICPSDAGSYVRV